MKEPLKLLLLAGVVTWWLWTPMTPALGQGRGQGFRPCPYVPYTCPVTAICKPFSEKGKVVRVYNETLKDAMEPGMALTLEVPQRGQVQVSLGPVWYLERQPFELLPGEEVEVKGMCEEQKDGGLRVIAFQVIKGDHLLNLRDEKGYPNWEAWRKR